ncbi:hypothetical protein FSP39_009508 [Pinctada imbricata]|uniref:E3 SUMO-protein ligase NSE2 n=1 Tax=Pinctada imbricata TaxID=66713 RepID=A0AA88XUV5_PINIB|nr:hypothetical protein FSP39_009508 [Pinctada imbricata]
MSSGGHLGVVEQAIKSMITVKDYIHVGMETTRDLADDFVDCAKGSEKQIEELKSIMLDYVNMERDLKQFLEAVEEVKDQASNTNENLNLESMLDNKLKSIVGSKNNPPSEEHPKYQDLIEKIWEIQNPGAVPSSAPTQEMVVDEDLAMTQSEQSTRCPYTGKDMVIPVRNRHCGHRYDKDGIMHYIKTKKSKAKCPVGGCGNTNPMVAADLVEDHELRRIIERKNKQANKRSKQRD